MQKILIIRFSSIGDIVLTTPLIRCIKKQLPDAEIHYLTKEKFYPVIKANPNISRIHTFKDDLGQVIRSLKKINFDFIVDLHKNLRSTRVKLALRKPAGSFDKLNFKKWLIVNLKINKLPEEHIVERYFKSLNSLGVGNDKKGLDHYIPEEDLGIFIGFYGIGHPFKEIPEPFGRGLFRDDPQSPGKGDVPLPGQFLYLAEFLQYGLRALLL